MKANELMIGDWVRLCDSKAPLQMEDVSGTAMFKKWTTDGEYMIPFSYSEIEPIPLTPEILEKNGFENDFYEDESVADYVKVRLEGYSLRYKANGWDDALVTWCNGHLEVVTDFNGEVRKDIEHVHQLQHALRICGIDKEIVI